MAFAFFPACAASIDGTVLNSTTNKPQPGVIVSLVQPGSSGMQTLASVKSDAQGKFRIDRDAPAGQTPLLLQALRMGVTYNKMLAPGLPTSGVTVSVYDAAIKVEAAKITQHMILLQPTEQELAVNETILFNNEGRVTFDDPANGTLRFFLPADANGKVQVIINAPGGMPISRPAEKTRQADIYKVSYPVRPGETRFDLAYTLPATKSFAGKILHQEGPTRLVAPATVTLAGAALEALGQEPTTQAHIYNVKGGEFTVAIEGTGTLRGPDTPADDSGAPSVRQSLPRLYDKLYLVLALAFAILGLGFVLLYRKQKA